MKAGHELQRDFFIPGNKTDELRGSRAVARRGHVAGFQEKITGNINVEVGSAGPRWGDDHTAGEKSISHSAEGARSEMKCIIHVS